MSDTPGILLIDDGELEEVAAMLDHLHVAYTRLRGGSIDDEVAPPSELLIASPRRASVVRRGSPAGAGPRKPLRIIAADEDSKAMRRMLRRMGFHLLVRRGAHPDVWRLLVERAMFQGDDRREHERMPVGAAVSLVNEADDADAPGLEAEGATLIDISNRGCRVRTSEWLAPGSRLSLDIGLPEPEGGTLRASGRIVRSSMDAGIDGGEWYSAGMLFDEDMPLAERERLGRLLNDLSVGPGALGAADPDSLPECESPVIPGLTLDAETDPALPAGVDVGVRRDGAGDGGWNRRQTARGSFSGRVFAQPQEDAAETARSAHVLMGRDLSAGGMRVDAVEGVATGDLFELAIYGPGEPHPFLVRARVDRDDGDRGLVLRFENVGADVAEGLEKLVACLPDIESLEEGERGGLGAVISEVLARTPIENA